MKRRVLIVCTANICRSPMAQALLADKVARAADRERFLVESAGTRARAGDAASDLARAAIRRRGLNLESHRSRAVTVDLLRQVDLVLVMTHDHKQGLLAEFPFIRSRVYLVSELGGLQYDIADPYGLDAAAYELCARELAQLIEDGYPRISEWLDRVPAAPQPEADR